jgi:glyoxylase-like metal-dependent hydrolase (beta-lactamase superfamily II)
MRLTERTYLVGSGSIGFDISDAYDCHVYLIDGGSELALVDAGAGRTIDPIVENIRRDGLDPAKLRYVLLTHAHADHAGAAATWRERFEVEMVASPLTAEYVRSADEERINLKTAREKGVYPSDYEFRACEVKHELREGDRFKIGDLEVEAIETPGHSSDMLSFLLEDTGRRCLFDGDTVFHGGKLAIISTWDCNLPQYAQSVAKLSAIEVDALFPGHLSVSLQRGGRHIQRAHKRFQNMEVPPSIV